MKNYEKLLWIILAIIVLFILIVVFVVLNNNVSDNEINNTNNDSDNILININTWFCYDAVHISVEGMENKLEINNMHLKFSDEFFYKCIGEQCEEYTYVIKDSLLILNNLNEAMLDEKYTIKYDEHTLILEEEYESGAKNIYYFTVSLG